jgi:two-component system sensor histidine kinase MprB
MGAVIAAVLVAFAIVAVGVTWRALATIDSEKALTAARALTMSMRLELAGGDSPDEAARELLATAPGDEQAQVRVGGDTWGTLPAAFVSLEPGTCATAAEAARFFRACSAHAATIQATVAIDITAHRRVVERLARFILAALLCTVIGAVLAVRIVLRPPLSALQDLTRWADGVTHGDLTAPPHGGTLEIDRLAVAFEALVRRLLDALERERATLAYLAHELRTPLTAMRIELSAQSVEGDPRAARLVADAARLGRVIDAVLLLANPNRDTRADTAVNIADLAREIAPPDVRVDAPDEAVVRVHGELVALAITNLVDNARRHAPGAAAAITVARQEAGVRIGVVDQGPGLDTEACRRMFDRHWRGKNGSPGFGLGLALVKAVAERHGGQADVRSRPGGGLDVGFSMGPILLWHDEAPPIDPL